MENVFVAGGPDIKYTGTGRPNLKYLCCRGPNINYICRRIDLTSNISVQKRYLKYLCCRRTLHQKSLVQEYMTANIVLRHAQSPMIKWMGQPLLCDKSSLSLPWEIYFVLSEKDIIKSLYIFILGEYTSKRGWINLY